MTYKLYCGDFVEKCADIADGSIDAIVTDPPYLKQYVPLYDELAKVAKRVLKPNGSLFVLCGAYHLDKYLINLSKSLRYFWIFSYVQKDIGNCVIWPRKVVVKWKPVLWFVNGDKEPLGLRGKPTFFDVIMGNGKNKIYHHWGQEPSLFLHLIHFFTNEGDTVLDPMVGGGEVGVAALQLKRNFIGIDIDPQAVAITQKRLEAIKSRACIPWLEDCREVHG